MMLMRNIVTCTRNTGKQAAARKWSDKDIIHFPIYRMDDNEIIKF